MANIETKYDYGQLVTCHGLPGMITAIFVRGNAVSYEFSYLSSDGDPKGLVVAECELSVLDDTNVGFKSG
jgi:hypothetical protein